MAEYMLRAVLPEDTEWSVASAGTMTGNGMDATANSVDVLREIGIDMSGHRTRAVTEDIINEADVIAAMTQSHIDELLDIVPSAKEKMFLVRSFDPSSDTRDVPDPVGWDIDIYRGTREMFSGALPGLLEFLDQLEGA